MTALAWLVVSASQAAPVRLVHEGLLLTPGGGVSSGPESLTFSVYPSPSATTPDWSETLAVTLDEGNYRVVLGMNPSNPLVLDDLASGAAWLGVRGSTGFEARQPLTPTPYAIVATTTSAVTGPVVADTLRVGGAPAIGAGGVWLGASDGLVGLQGPPGPQGALGAVGSQGPQGLIGATGPTGPDGPRGATGSKGPTGGRGPTGNNGSTGATGPADTVYGCVLASSCASGWSDRGTAGLIMSGSNPSCPGSLGAMYNDGWRWCHPRWCCVNL